MSDRECINPGCTRRTRQLEECYSCREERTVIMHRNQLHAAQELPEYLKNLKGYTK